MSVDISSTKEQQRQADALIENVNREALHSKGVIERGGSFIAPMPLKSFRSDKLEMVDYLPIGKGNTLFSGDGDTGKSSTARRLAYRVSRGLTEGSWHGQPHGVMFILSEDSPGDVRLAMQAHGADLDRIVVMAESDNPNMTGAENTTVSIPDDIPYLREYCRDHDIRMVVFDALTECLTNARLDKHKDVSAAIVALNKWAQQEKMIIASIHHDVKDKGVRAKQAALGSEAFVNKSRVLVSFVRNDDTGEHLFQITKGNNLADEVKTPYRFEFATRTVQSDSGPTDVGIVTNVAPADVSVDDTRKANAFDSQGDDSNGDAIDWITDYLRDGPAPFNAVKKAGLAEGFSINQLRNAQKRAHDPAIVSMPDPEWSGRGQRRLWCLSDDPISGQQSQCIQVTTNDHKSKSQAAVGLTNSGHLWSSGSTESTTTNPRPLDLARFDTAQRDGLIAAWVKQLDRDGPTAIDQKLARMTPESLELLNQRGGALKTATDREYERRSRQLAPTA